MRGGARGWAALVVLVAVFDVWAVLNRRETMSAAFYRWTGTPRGLALTGALWGYLTAHLFRVLPEWADLAKWLPSDSDDDC